MLARPPRTARRRLRFAPALAPLVVLLLAAGAVAAPGGNGKGGGGGGGGGGKSGRGPGSPPSVSISAPSAGTTVSGSVSVSGSASDGTSLADVQVSVDGGAYQSASGTTSWSFPLDTASYPDGSHTIAAQATDSSGKTAVASETVTFSNSTTTDTPPTVSISAPSPGSTVAGTVTVSGSASDDVGVAAVQVSVDGGAYQAAQGTASWSYSLDTTALTDGSHTIAARATDTSGNVSSTSESVTVQNGTTQALPPGVAEQLVTPEGATIDVYSDATGWTAQQIYDLLKPNAYQLSLVGPHLTIKVEGSTYTSSTGTGAACCDTSGGYYNYKATIVLGAETGSTFDSIPDAIIAHEYGHAWSYYHYYLDENASWSAYLQARGLAGDSRVDDGEYMWSTPELIAEDYRLLFGTQAAQDEMAQMNYLIPDARDVPGLHDFLATSW